MAAVNKKIELVDAALFLHQHMQHFKGWGHEGKERVLFCHVLSIYSMFEE